MWEVMNGALAQLRSRASPQTYEVFCRRFVQQQSAREIGAAMGLSSKAVYRRCDRLRRDWETLVGDKGL